MQTVIHKCDRCGFKQEGHLNGQKKMPSPAEVAEAEAKGEKVPETRDFFTVVAIFNKGVQETFYYSSGTRIGGALAKHFCAPCLVEMKIISAVDDEKPPASAPTLEDFLVDLVRDVATEAAIDAIQNR